MRNKGKPIPVFLAFLATCIYLANTASVNGGENGRSAPEITGQTWINTDPLRLADLKGKVVMVEFWTFGCYNCRNVQPYVKEWHRKYADQGLVVIGVHTPETDFERYSKNVEHYVHEEQIPYAVVTDNDFATWTRYGNRAWPTVYLIDKQGIIRYMHIGEGAYPQTEEFIRELLDEN
jgi:thiol-disulfide isomerase/thioredoxin